MSKVYFNKARTSSVVLDKIKEYTITESIMYSGKYDLRGWYNKTNNFFFGEFDSEEEARGYLNKIHNILIA